MCRFASPRVWLFNLTISSNRELKKNKTKKMNGDANLRLETPSIFTSVKVSLPASTQYTTNGHLLLGEKMGTA